MTGLKLFKDFMFDIETTGLEPNRHAIIQISAVPFNFHTKEISDVYFDKCLRVPNWRHSDQNTISWWLSKNMEVYNSIVTRMEPPGQVISLLGDFIKSLAGYDFATNRYPDKTQQPRFWFKRPFDWQFVEGYYNDFSIDSPFHYHNAIEMTAYLKGVGKGLMVPHVDIKHDGPKHDAYSDACYQIKKLFAVLDQYGGIAT